MNLLHVKEMCMFVMVIEKDLSFYWLALRILYMGKKACFDDLKRL